MNPYNKKVAHPAAAEQGNCPNYSQATTLYLDDMSHKKRERSGSGVNRGGDERRVHLHRLDDLIHLDTPLVRKDVYQRML